jgi:hypothetical protein
MNFVLVEYCDGGEGKENKKENKYLLEYLRSNYSNQVNYCPVIVINHVSK